MKDEGAGNREQGAGSSDRGADLAKEVPVSASPLGNCPPPPKRPPLAYENPAYRNSAEGRLIRSVAEYGEPLARFRKEQIQDTVVFFGSARFRGHEEAHH